MGGTPANASLWADADVYVAASLAATNPTDASTAFSSGWTLVGLLDGGDGFTEGRNETVNDYFAWGGLIVATSRKDFKLTMSFTALEDNPTTRSLIWPGSTATQLVVPTPAKVKMAFETRKAGVVRRRITQNYAEVTLSADVKETDQDLTKYPLIATVYPDGNKVLFIEQNGTTP